MKSTLLYPLFRRLVPALTMVALLVAGRAAAQDPAIAPPVPDYSAGIAKFLQLGLPDVKEAKYIKIENGYGFYDRSGMMDDLADKLTGNAWLLKDKGNGRVDVLAGSLKVMELVEPKVFEEIQKKKMEARMKALQKKGEELEEEDVEDFMMQDEQVQGGKWKDADLKKDLAMVLDKLKKGKEADEFDFQFNTSVGKTFLFAAHAAQKGYKDEANQIIDQLFKKAGDSRKVLGQAMNELADAQYADAYSTFSKSGVFANLLLADEINRTPPKTQAALLEAMQEKQVTVASQTRQLEEPFIVFATQNPIEHEGTYPLPEAQLDRFFFSLRIEYPSMDEERQIILRRNNTSVVEALKREELLELQGVVDTVPLPDHVTDAILKLVHSSRPQSTLADDYVKRYVEWGAGPRASQNLAKAARAFAMLDGNPAASLEDVKRAAVPVLRHRIIPNYNATGEGITAETIVEHLIRKL